MGGAVVRWAVFVEQRLPDAVAWATCSEFAMRQAQARYGNTVTRVQREAGLRAAEPVLVPEGARVRFRWGDLL